jgi:subfamily B ATP-binding cassette protein MsbA
MRLSAGRRIRSLTRDEGARHVRRGLRQRRYAQQQQGPQPSERPMGEKLGVVWRETRELLAPRRGRLAVGFALMMVNRLAGLVLPASSKFVVDEVIANRRVDLLLPIAAAALAATLVQSASSFTLAQLLGIAAQRAITDMRRRIHEHVLRLPVRYFDATQAGTVASRVMHDAEGIRNLVGTGLVQLAGSLVTATVALGVLLWLNWQLTLAILVILAVSAGVTMVVLRRLRPLFRERWKILSEVNGRLTEALGGIRIVKAYTAEGREDLVFTRGAHRLFRKVASTMTGVAGLTAFSNIVVGLVGAMMIVVGGRAILGGVMTLGDFVMFVFFTGLLAAPVVQIASIGTELTEAFAGLDRLRELRQLETEAESDRGRAPLGDVRGDVAFDDVWFGYDPAVPVLKGISFTAPAGSTTALVGPSGAGKTTLIGLVMAFHRPQRGRVLVDGRDLEHLALRDYRARLGVVLQDNFLFDGTIAENIAYARPGATREEIERVGRISHVSEFADQFKEGYDTIVGERGVKLSGGQRQRVAIARAILADPRILLLDEATSSLDSESEAFIQDGLRRLRAGRTTFVIAHRLSTIRSADQILVLDHGEIVERGTHEELLARDGRYRQLHDRQARVERDRFGSKVLKF